MNQDEITQRYGQDVHDDIELSYLFGLLADETSYPLKGGSLRNSEVLDCARKLRYHYEGIEPSDPDEPDLRTILKFQEGNHHETQIIEALKRGGVRIANQQDWVRATIAGIRIYGRIDAKLSAEVLLEIKTIESHVDLEAMTTPKPRHRTQVQLYMKYHNLRECVFFYKARDTGAIKVFREQIDNRLLDAISTNITKVSKGDLETLERKRVHECTWCRYRTSCWQGAVPAMASNNQPTPVIGKDTDSKQLIYDVRGLDQGHCRSCGTVIFWAITQNLKKMPVNNKGISHFTDCPNASKHSRKAANA
jgi:hypothetical protein